MNSFLNGLIASAVIGYAVAATGPAVAQSINCPTTPSPTTPVLVCDAKHKLVGIANTPGMDTPHAGEWGTVAVRTQNTVLAMTWTSSNGFLDLDIYGAQGLYVYAKLYYLTNNCTGPAYLPVDVQPQPGYAFGGKVLFAGHPFQELPINSAYVYEPPGGPQCLKYSGSEMLVGKETSVPLSKLGFTPPFSIE